MSRSCPPDPLKVFDRSTPAGRMLHLLYSKDPVGKAAGNSYSDQNALALQEIQSRASQASGTTTPTSTSTLSKKGLSPSTAATPKSQTKVKVPKFNKQRKAVRGEQGEHDSKPKGKKPLAVIQDELSKEGLEAVGSHRPPLQGHRRPLLDNAEKLRLQQVMEWGSAEAAEKINSNVEASVKSAKEHVTMSPMDERQHLLDQIVQEIREREEFLEEMDKYGKRHKYEQQINTEIAQRISFLRKNDMTDPLPQ